MTQQGLDCLNQHIAEGVVGEAGRAGERQVVAGRADGCAGRHHALPRLAGGPVGHRLGDEGVGVEREMGTVLFKGAQRDRHIERPLIEPLAQRCPGHLPQSHGCLRGR